MFSFAAFVQLAQKTFAFNFLCDPCSLSSAFQSPTYDVKLSHSDQMCRPVEDSPYHGTKHIEMRSSILMEDSSNWTVHSEIKDDD